MFGYCIGEKGNIGCVPAESVIAGIGPGSRTILRMRYIAYANTVSGEDLQELAS